MRTWNEIDEDIVNLDLKQNELDLEIKSLKDLLKKQHDARTALFSRRRELQVEALEAEGRPVFPVKNLDGMRANSVNYQRLKQEKDLEHKNSL